MILGAEIAATSVVVVMNGFSTGVPGFARDVKRNARDAGDREGALTFHMLCGHACDLNNS